MLQMTSQDSAAILKIVASPVARKILGALAFGKLTGRQLASITHVSLGPLYRYLHLMERHRLIVRTRDKNAVEHNCKPYVFYHALAKTIRFEIQGDSIKMLVEDWNVNKA